MTERGNENTTKVELILPRVEDMPVLPEGISMDKRQCAECGETVWFEPHPDVEENDAVIVCSRCRLALLAGMEDEMCSGVCGCCDGTIEGEIASSGHETDAEVRPLLN